MKTKFEFGNFSSEKLRTELGESVFLDSYYDPAIMGYNPTNGSVIYFLVEMIHLVMKEEDGDGELYIDGENFDDDFYDSCMQKVLDLFESFENSEDCVAPTLFEEFI